MHIPVFAEPVSPLLETGVRYIIQETLGDRPGSSCLLARLTELMFVEILRNQMQQISEQQLGLLAALNDSIVSQVLNLLHARPEHNWTVTVLAKQVGVSRSTLNTVRIRSPRLHWGIENGLHWTMDVTFDEDACRVRTGHAPQNFALLRRIALNALNFTVGRFKWVSLGCSLEIIYIQIFFRINYESFSLLNNSKRPIVPTKKYKCHILVAFFFLKVDKKLLQLLQ